MVLTAEERSKFAAWLRQFAESSEIVAKQSAQLGAIGEVIAKRQRAEAIAATAILRVLEATESQSIEV